MSGRCRRTSAAERDIAQIATHLAQRGPALGVRFLDAVEDTLAFLTRSPDVGSAYSSGREALQGLRVWRVDGFRNHLVFYRIIDSGVQVVRVLHAARDIERALTERQP